MAEVITRHELESSKKIFITPRARKFARDNGIDIEALNIQGTGFQGGICEKDIIIKMKEQKPSATPLARKLAQMEGIDMNTVLGSGVRGKIYKKDIEKQLEVRFEDDKAGADLLDVHMDEKVILESIDYTGIRKIIGDRLSESKVSAPHIYFMQSSDLTRLLELRKDMNEIQEKKTSITDYILLALVKALQKYPDLNSSLVENKIIKYKSVNLGVAVGAEKGLIVPVIKNAENMNLMDISKEAGRLIERARDGKLLPEEYSGGTFTVSNLGMYEIENFTAIINPPEVGILAVSAVVKKPVVLTDNKGNDEIVIRPIMTITLSADHRVVDGLMAAQFVKYVKMLLESPLKLLI